MVHHCGLKSSVRPIWLPRALLWCSRATWALLATGFLSIFIVDKDKESLYMLEQSTSIAVILATMIAILLKKSIWPTYFKCFKRKFVPRDTQHHITLLGSSSSFAFVTIEDWCISCLFGFWWWALANRWFCQSLQWPSMNEESTCRQTSRTDQLENTKARQRLYWEKHCSDI